MTSRNPFFLNCPWQGVHFTQGEKLQLIRLVIKKLQKGNSVEETADMLEEEPENIRKIYEIAASMAPDYDVEKIYQKL